jgi:hypothetical protein
MDAENRFHTNETWLLMRAEHLVLLVALCVLVALHLGEVRWGRFVFAFVIIDLIGYIPGAIAYRRQGGGKIAPVYHYLYNVTHSYLTASVVVAVWALWAGRFEWAMLAIPIHYSGDRGIFGNIYKPLELSFEPVARDSRSTGAIQVAELREETR